MKAQRTVSRSLAVSARFALAVAGLALAIPATASATAYGDLAQLPGTAGCISETGEDFVGGTAGACVDSRGPDPAGLIATNDMAISPDGQNAYVAARTSFLTAYELDAGSGEIAGIAGAGGCKSNAAVLNCEQVNRLGGATGVAVSPDGENVYVVTRDSRSIVGFDRDAGSGALTPVAGTGGCVKELAPFVGCADGRGLSGATDVVVTPDGLHVFVSAGVAGGSDAIAVLDRNPATGELTQPAGTAGCISATGADFPAGTLGACADATLPLDDPQELAISPDGDHLYVATNTSDAVSVFEIQGGGELGELSCISQLGGAPCSIGRGLDGLFSLAISPDGNQVYTGGGTSFAVSTLDRDQSTGELSQDPGPAGCISDFPLVEGCATGRSMRGFGVAVSPDGRNVYVASLQDSVAVADRAADGDLSQSAGAEGCWGENTSLGCSDGRALTDATAIGFDAAGSHMYVASETSRAVAAFERNVDSTPPGAPVITQGPEGPTIDDDPVFAFSEPDAVSFDCRLDPIDSFAPCTSPVAYTDLVDGTYRFEVRATDAALNTGPAASRFFALEHLPDPVAGNRAVGAVESGTVKIKKPRRDFRTVGPGEVVRIPVGTVVDVTDGELLLVSEQNRATHAIRRGHFSDGRFRFLQDRSRTPVTELVLAGGPDCGRLSRKKKGRSNKLFGRSGGGHRTTGSYGSATVRGTRWLTENLCRDGEPFGTRFTVVEGRVKVRDFSDRSIRFIKTGRRYVVRAPAGP